MQVAAWYTAGAQGGSCGCSSRVASGLAPAFHRHAATAMRSGIQRPPGVQMPQEYVIDWSRNSLYMSLPAVQRCRACWHEGEQNTREGNDPGKVAGAPSQRQPVGGAPCRLSSGEVQLLTSSAPSQTIRPTCIIVLLNILAGARQRVGPRRVRRRQQPVAQPVEGAQQAAALLRQGGLKAADSLRLPRRRQGLSRQPDVCAPPCCISCPPPSFSPANRSERKPNTPRC